MITADDLDGAAGLRNSVRAFRHPAFRRFWTAALVSNAGTWLSNLTVPFVLFQLTHSALWVGLAALAQFLPTVVGAPYGGALADRFERRRVLLVTQTGLASSAVALWALWVSGAREPVAILGVVAVAGVFQGLNLPAWQSFVNDLVPRGDLSSAVALNSLQFNAARSVGPAVAGVLLATIGPGWAFLVNAVTFVVVIGALLSVRTRAVVIDGPRGSFLASYLEAARYVAGQRGIQAAILVSVLVGVLGNPVFGFTVVFSGDVFHIDAIGLGLLNAALGLGAVIVAPIVASGHSGGLSRNVRWTFVVFAGALAAFAATDLPVVGGLALVVVGASFMAIVSSANTAMQLIVADHMRGRVLAMRISVYSISLPAGSLVQGWISDQVGPRLTVLGAAGCMLVVGLFLALWRDGAIVRRLDDAPDRTAPR